MNSEDDPRAWVAKAEEDFEMARLALRRKKPLTDPACFHAQQCAEKYLRGCWLRVDKFFQRRMTFSFE
jgi:HEPN domain-containing protein